MGAPRSAGSHAICAHGASRKAAAAPPGRRSAKRLIHAKVGGTCRSWYAGVSDAVRERAVGERTCTARDPGVRRPGRRVRAPRAGPPPAGIVAAEPPGPPRPAIAAWRSGGPTHAPMQARPPRAAQSARPGARPHIPGAHSVSRHGTRTVRGWIRAIRHKPLNGRDAANYAGCTRFAHVRAARVSGACAASSGNRRPRWLNRVQGEGDPRTPRHDQAGRPAPSGITR
jgi:hypothetical protein